MNVAYCKIIHPDPFYFYRNHGADVGRILVGLQVPADERSAFTRFLKSVGFEYVDETNNPAYRLFLA